MGETNTRPTKLKFARLDMFICLPGSAPVNFSRQGIPAHRVDAFIEEVKEGRKNGIVGDRAVWLQTDEVTEAGEESVVEISVDPMNILFMGVTYSEHKPLISKPEDNRVIQPDFGGPRKRAQ